MDTIEFLRYVLPEDGYYVGAILVTTEEGNYFRHFYADDVEQLGAFIQKASSAKLNVYYAVASFADKASRKNTNVSEIKLIALDIDCGPKKPYASPSEAIPVLVGFIKEYGLPNPTIVSSGNGLHVYWTLSESVSLAEWKPVAEAMKSAVINYGLQIDPAVTADASRVLRPIGTVNPKGGKPVKLLKHSPHTDLETLRSLLPMGTTKSRVNLGMPADVPEHIKNKTSSLTEAMGATAEFAPADATTVRIKCKQIDWAAGNPDQVDEPLWYNVLGVAAFCHNPEKTAIEWSDGHPDYSPENTLKKLYQWKYQQNQITAKN